MRSRLRGVRGRGVPGLRPGVPGLRRRLRLIGLAATPMAFGATTRAGRHLDEPAQLRGSRVVVRLNLSCTFFPRSQLNTHTPSQARVDGGQHG